VAFISRHLDSILLCYHSKQEQAMMSSFVDVSKRFSHIRNPSFQSQADLEPYMLYLFKRYHAAAADRNAFITIWQQPLRE